MRKALSGAIAAIMVNCAALAQADEVVIAALGDSLTQGYGLPAVDGFVPQLQAWLDAKGADVRIVNAGVSGDTTAGGLARVEWTLTPDVDGIIVALGGNDLLRGLEPAQARSNIDGILQAADQADVAVLLIGMQAPGNFGADYKTQFDALYPELAKKHGALFANSFFMGLMVEGALPDPASLRNFLQADGIHPNAAGVTQIVEGLGPKVMQLVAQLE